MSFGGGFGNPAHEPRRASSGFDLGSLFGGSSSFATSSQLGLPAERWTGIDPFDRVQLELVIKTCKESKTLSDAGRKLFEVSRVKRSKMNDADRLKKYLARFKLQWDDVK